MKGGLLNIRTMPNYIPKQCYTSRAVPIHLEDALRKELDEQIKLDILEWAKDTNDPAEPCSPMVAVRKKRRYTRANNR